MVLSQSPFKDVKIKPEYKITWSPTPEGDKWFWEWLYYKEV